MKDKKDILSSKITDQLVQLLSKNNHILAAYLFGSKVSDHNRQDSDLDLAIVVSDRKQADELVILPEISKIPFPHELDLSVVDLTSSPVFLYQIIKNGICLYAKSIGAKNDFEAKVMHIYYDSEHIRDIYHYYLDKSIKGDTYGR